MRSWQNLYLRVFVYEPKLCDRENEKLSGRKSSEWCKWAIDLRSVTVSFIKVTFLLEFIFGSLFQMRLVIGLVCNVRGRTNIPVLLYTLLKLIRGCSLVFLPCWPLWPLQRFSTRTPGCPCRSVSGNDNLQCIPSPWVPSFFKTNSLFFWYFYRLTQFGFCR